MTVSGLTLLSRILGLLRDRAIAQFLGVGGISDAWNAAFQLPNLSRRIFGEGAFNSAFIPLYNGSLEKGEKQAHDFANRVVIWLSLILAVLTVICFIFIKPIMWLFNVGFDAETMALSVTLGRITIGYLFFVCLLSAFSGILNSHKSFAAPSISYAMLNVLFLGALYGIVPFVGHPEQVLSWTLLTAGLVQFMIVFVPAWRLGFRPKMLIPRLDVDIHKLGVLMVPGLLSAGVQQMNLMVGSQVASCQQGAKTVIYMADRINQLPLGLIGIAFGVVLLPDISRKIKGGQAQEARESLRSGVTMAMFLALPAMVGMTVLAFPIIDVLFSGKKFTSGNAMIVSQALFVFALSCPAYIMARVVQSGYFAQENTKTPMVFTLVSALVNIALCGAAWLLLREQKMLHIGCAAATTVAGWVNVLLLTRGLSKQGWLNMDKELWVRLLKMFVASLMMGVVVWFAQDLLKDTLMHGWVVLKFVVLLLIASTGVVSYFLVAYWLKAMSLSDLKSGFLRS